MKRSADIRRLWVFDFDGTLSPLVPDRTAARLHPEAFRLLRLLALNPQNSVAVLSSRALNDLIPRVPIPGVFLGGGSGLEWRIPGTPGLSPGEQAEQELEDSRSSVCPLLKRISNFPGVDCEDKHWSVAIHYRQVLPLDIPRLSQLIADLTLQPKIRLFKGPAVVEVQFLPQVNKSLGVRKLCRLLHFDPPEGGIIYAGDDENDVAAMRWVLGRKGHVFIVGNRVRIEGARHADDPVDLVGSLRELMRSEYKAAGTLARTALPPPCVASGS